MNADNIIPFHPPHRWRARPTQAPLALKLYRGRPCRVLWVGRAFAWVEFLSDEGHLVRRHVPPAELSGIGEPLPEASAPCDTEPEPPRAA